MPNREQAEAGFTLLEVMAAFVIASLAAILLYRGGFSAVVQASAAARYQEAVVRAQSRLASVGTLTPLEPMQASGEDGGGFQWRLSIVPEQSSGALTLYAVRVTESFGGRAVVLATQRLAAGP